MKKFLFVFIFCTYLIFISCNEKKKVAPAADLFHNKNFVSKTATSKLIFLDSLQQASQAIINDSVARNFLFDLSTEYFNLNQNQKSATVCKQVLQLSIAAKDTLSIAKSYSYLGDTHEVCHKDSAYYFYQKSEKLYQSLKNSKLVGKMLLKKGYLLFNDGNCIESEIQVSKALLYLKNSADADLLFTSYSLMGLNFEKLEEYNDAIKYQLLAKKVLSDEQKYKIEPSNKFLCTIESSINTANIYIKTLQYKKSIQELESVLTNELKEKFPYEYAATIGNLAYSKMKSGKLEGVRKTLEEALAISIKNKTDNSTIYKLMHLGEYYAIVRDTAQSIQFLKRALLLAEKIKMGDEIKESLQFLSKIDYKNARIYDKRNLVVTDSLAKIQRINRNKYARIQYETSIVSDENKSLTTKNNYILTISLLLIFAMALALLYWYLYTQKREILFRISQQKAEEEIFALLKEYQIKLAEAKELEQNRISRELHDSVMNKLYGARLQLGILNESDDKEIKIKRLVYVDLLQKIEQEIRTIAHDLHTDAIDAQFDYVSLLSNLIQHQNEIGSTTFSLNTGKNIDWNKVDSLVKLTIFRILQESAQNVSKHSKAATCTIFIKTSKDKNTLVVTITDNGIGFVVSDKTDGIGLKNIKERANAVKATLHIESNFQKGTTFEIIFPMKPSS